MATSNPPSDPAPAQWYWLSEEPKGLNVEKVTGAKVSILSYNPPAGWQPYSEKDQSMVRTWLIMDEKDNNVCDNQVLRIGLFLPLINGHFDYSWSDMAVDFCNGIVMIDGSNYVNINEMRQYDKYNRKASKQVKREPPIGNKDDYYFHSQEEIIGQLLTSAEVKSDVIELQTKMKKANERSEFY